jgi:dihydroorotate dehydrogenase
MKLTIRGYHGARSTTVNGMLFENPFLLGSGPPGTNGKVIAKSYDLGWGGMVCKTFSTDADKVINTTPRYAKLRGRASEEVIGFQNIELISDRPYADWLDDLTQLKKQYPKKILVASVMEEYRKEAWQRIVREVQATGVDVRLGLSCRAACPSAMAWRWVRTRHREVAVGQSGGPIPVWAR